MRNGAASAVDEHVIELRDVLGPPAGPTPELDPALRRHVHPRRVPAEDWPRFEENIAEILGAFGWTWRRSAPATPLGAFCEPSTTQPPGYEGDPKLLTAFPTEARDDSDTFHGQIVEGPIAFSALCEHHALPFDGHAHVGYVAGTQIIGISKLTRLVRLFARRFTVQERLGEQIADTLVELIQPEGVAVHLEASHMCTQMRGVEEHLLDGDDLLARRVQGRRPAPGVPRARP